MDAYQAARAVIAFSDFVAVGSNSGLGPGTSIQTNVRGFSRGSFEVEFSLVIAAAARALLEGATPPEVLLLGVMEESIGLFRWLKGSSPSRIEYGENTVSLTNVEGDNITINQNITNVILDPETGTALSGFVAKPLQAGAGSVILTHEERGEIARVESSEAEYYRPIGDVPELLENEVRMVLKIVTINFGEGKKWRFSTGATTFWADIEDEEYVERIRTGQARFGKGDTLVARVRIVQRRGVGGAIVEQRSIRAIERHAESETPEQGDLWEATFVES